MNTNLFIALFLYLSGSAVAQAQTTFIDSNVLESKQTIQIKLPQSYNQSDNLRYPIILVLNSDYLLKPVIGQLDYQTYFGKTPESIIVGFNYKQGLRGDVSSTKTCDEKALIESKYYGFITKELLPFMDANFKTSKFKVIVGDNDLVSIMSNLVISKEPVFQACVNLNPEFNCSLDQDIINRVQGLTHDISYYVAASSNHQELLKETFVSPFDALKRIENTYFNFIFDDFDNADEHTVVLRGIARALERVFEKDQMPMEANLNHKVYSYENTLDD